MAGGRAFKSNVRERREAERKMKQMLKRQRKDERRKDAEAEATPDQPASDELRPDQS